MIGCVRQVLQNCPDPPAGFQDVPGDSQFMRRGANVVVSVVQHQVLEVHQLAVDPQRGAGVREVGSFDKTLPDRRTRDPFVETRQRDASARNRPQQYVGPIGWERRYKPARSRW
ncbi:hypothetical protein ACVJBD_007189 [Rhizobium mongolense]